jgi:hypothetical protein
MLVKGQGRGSKKGNFSWLNSIFSFKEKGGSSLERGETFKALFLSVLGSKS